MPLTLEDRAARAVLPWRSLDAESVTFDSLPQQSIDVCLMCQHSASHCERCGDWRTRNVGRPRKEINYDLLHELLSLKRCNREICSALGISTRTLQTIKKELN